MVEVEGQEPCEACDGTGLFANRKCKECDGKGYYESTKNQSKLVYYKHS